MATPIRIEVDEELAKLVSLQANPGVRRSFLENPQANSAEWAVKGLFYLSCQGQGSEAIDALDRLRRLAPNIIEDAYRTGTLEQPILDLLAKDFGTHTPFLGRLILNNELSDDAFHYLVVNGTDTVIDTIRRRNMNLLNSPAIIECLFENQKVRKGTIDRILQILGLEVKISAEEDEDTGEVAKADEEELEELEEPVERRKRQRTGPGAEGEEPASVASSAFNPELFKSFLEGREWNFATDLMGDDKNVELSDDERITLFQSVMRMAVADKLMLAIRGNREARNLLLRDSNRLIPLYVLQNPRITDDEISQVANSPSSSRELVVEVSRNREWTKNYKVKRSLAINPKTPLDKAMRFLNSLNFKDVRDISRSKNVPSALAIQARRLVQRKQDTGKMTEGGGSGGGH